MHQFSKIKGRICNIPVEAVNKRNILPRPEVSNGLWLNWKGIFNTGIMYILNQLVHTLCTRHLLIWNLVTNFMNIYLLQRVSQVKTCLSFLKLLKFKNNLNVLLKKKNVYNRKERTQNINDRNETEFASVEDPKNMCRTASNETTLVSQ